MSSSQFSREQAIKALPAQQEKMLLEMLSSKGIDRNFFEELMHYAQPEILQKIKATTSETVAATKQSSIEEQKKTVTPDFTEVKTPTPTLAKSDLDINELNEQFNGLLTICGRTEVDLSSAASIFQAQTIVQDFSDFLGKSKNPDAITDEEQTAAQAFFIEQFKNRFLLQEKFSELVSEFNQNPVHSILDTLEKFEAAQRIILEVNTILQSKYKEEVVEARAGKYFATEYDKYFSSQEVAETDKATKETKAEPVKIARDTSNIDFFNSIAESLALNAIQTESLTDEQFKLVSLYADVIAKECNAIIDNTELEQSDKQTAISASFKRRYDAISHTESVIDFKEIVKSFSPLELAQIDPEVIARYNPNKSDKDIFDEFIRHYALPRKEIVDLLARLDSAAIEGLINISAADKNNVLIKETILLCADIFLKHSSNDVIKVYQEELNERIKLADSHAEFKSDIIPERVTSISEFVSVREREAKEIQAKIAMAHEALDKSTPVSAIADRTQTVALQTVELKSDLENTFANAEELGGAEGNKYKTELWRLKIAEKLKAQLTSTQEIETVIGEMLADLKEFSTISSDVSPKLHNYVDSLPITHAQIKQELENKLQPSFAKEYHDTATKIQADITKQIEVQLAKNLIAILDNPELTLSIQKDALAKLDRQLAEARNAIDEKLRIALDASENAIKLTLQNEAFDHAKKQIKLFDKIITQQEKLNTILGKFDAIDIEVNGSKFERIKGIKENLAFINGQIDRAKQIKQQKEEAAAKVKEAKTELDGCDVLEVSITSTDELAKKLKLINTLVTSQRTEEKDSFEHDDLSDLGVTLTPSFSAPAAKTVTPITLPSSPEKVATPTIVSTPVETPKPTSSAETKVIVKTRELKIPITETKKPALETKGVKTIDTSLTLRELSDLALHLTNELDTIKLYASRKINTHLLSKPQEKKSLMNTLFGSTVDPIVEFLNELDSLNDNQALIKKIYSFIAHIENTNPTVKKDSYQITTQGVERFHPDSLALIGRKGSDTIMRANMVNALTPEQIQQIKISAFKYFIPYVKNPHEAARLFIYNLTKAYAPTRIYMYEDNAQQKYQDYIQGLIVARKTLTELAEEAMIYIGNCEKSPELYLFSEYMEEQCQLDVRMKNFRDSAQTHMQFIEEIANCARGTDKAVFDHLFEFNINDENAILKADGFLKVCELNLQYCNLAVELKQQATGIINIEFKNDFEKLRMITLSYAMSYLKHFDIIASQLGLVKDVCVQRKQYIQSVLKDLLSYKFTEGPKFSTKECDTAKTMFTALLRDFTAETTAWATPPKLPAVVKKAPIKTLASSPTYGNPFWKYDPELKAQSEAGKAKEKDTDLKTKIQLAEEKAQAAQKNLEAAQKAEQEATLSRNTPSIPVELRKIVKPR